MAGSAALVAKRALAVLLRAPAAGYSIAVIINRDSSDKEVTAACRWGALRAHPDHGRNAHEYV